MKKLLILVLLLSVTGSAFGEITSWWGLFSFRERYEVSKEFWDVTSTSSENEPGKLRYTDTNTKTRIGYKFGVKADLMDNLKAGVTFRSGIGSVMWQDIDNNSALLPGLLEAYIDWTTPYTELFLGKIPQEGNALWDLYTCANLREDWRLYNPTDGVFSDRLGSLNGVKLLIPVGPITLRGTYHTDYVAGYARDYPEEASNDDENNLDRQVFLGGIFAEYSGFEFDADFGVPTRVGNRYRDGRDSVYADEFIWGATLKKSMPDLYNSMIRVGYAFNSRDSIFTANFLDVIAQGEVAGFTITGRYQRGDQELEFGIYEGYEVVREAYHVYFNRKIWNLDLQPRLIWFLTEIEGEKQKTNLRLEVTSTVNF